MALSIIIHYITIKLLFLTISILLSVAFFTLLERKILGYIQKRKGPNKTGFKGIFQPFSDAIKLLSKETSILNNTHQIIYFLRPVITLIVSLLLWLSFPSRLGSYEITLSIVFIICCLSISVFPILGAGYSSNSKYSVLGRLRTVAQTISYEVRFAFIILRVIILKFSFNFQSFLTQFRYPVIIISPILAIMWFISALAETSRTPFDFAEGESELVSGFNTEYAARGFVLFFLAEYRSILFISLLFSRLFINSLDLTFSLTLFTILSAFLFIWVRGTFPRLRYDKLMALTWKVFLPIIIVYLILLFSLIIY